MSFRPQPPLMGQPPLPMMAAPFSQAFPVPVPGMPANMTMPPLPVGSLPPPPVMPGLLPTPIMQQSIQPLLPPPSSNSTSKSSSNSHSNSSSGGRGYHRDRHDRRNHDRSEHGGKSTTVFVGNITERASDALVRQILMKCGYIANWKRVQGASGRLQAFGFCEYASPDSALRSMRLLSDFQLGEKKLLVKVDSKTRAELDEYKQKKKEEKKAEGADIDDDYDVEKDPATKALDDSSQDDINKLVLDNGDVLSGKYEDSLPYMKKSHSGCTENLEGLDMDNAKKSLVSKEIRSFREAYRNEEKDKDKDKKDRDKDRDRDRRDRGRDRHGDKDHDNRDSHRRRDKDRRRGDDDHESKMKARTSREPSSTPVLDRSKRPKEDDKERQREKDRAGSDDEDDYEKRRLERRRREKDQVFFERLKEWEARERKRSRDYEKQYMKDEKKQNEQDEEREHLAEFLEDYDDDRDDPKYYRGSAFARRFRDRDIEKEQDGRDRQREAEEIEEVLRQQAEKPLIDQENKTPNIPLPVARPTNDFLKKENSPPPVAKFQAALVPTFANVKEETYSPSPAVPTTIAVTSSSPMNQNTDSMASFDSARSSPAAVPQHDVAPMSLKRDLESDDDTSPSHNDAGGKKTTFGFGMKVNQLSQQSNSKKLESVFNANDDESKNEVAPKRKLTRLDEEDVAQQQQVDDGSAEAQANAEDKKKIIRELIEKIPTGKDELFAYELKWDMVDQSLVDRRIKPWINKKIFQYIGEEEETLVEFVCSKVLTKCVPKNILEDVSMVLDDEAEVFVVKMWRLLIYETEAKSLGLVK